MPAFARGPRRSPSTTLDRRHQLDSLALREPGAFPAAARHHLGVHGNGDAAAVRQLAQLLDQPGNRRRTATQTITGASELDGLYALATNLPDPPGRHTDRADVLTIYKDQWIVEQRHRDLKQTLHVRPIFLHNDDRIHALIAVIGIALLVYGLIEADLRAPSAPTPRCPASCPNTATPSPPPAPC